MALVGELDEQKNGQYPVLKLDAAHFFANASSFYKNEVKYKYIYRILFVTKR